MRGALLLPVGRITFCIYYAFIRAKKNYRERQARRGDIYYPPPAADINITHKRAGDNKMHISNWCAKNYVHRVYRASHHHLNNNPRARFLSLKFEVMNIGATRHSYFFARSCRRECKCSPCRWFNKSWESARTEPVRPRAAIDLQTTIHNYRYYNLQRQPQYHIYMNRAGEVCEEAPSAADQECAARARPGLRSPLINRINHSQSARFHLVLRSHPSPPQQNALQIHKSPFSGFCISWIIHIKDKSKERWCCRADFWSQVLSRIYILCIC